MSKTYIYKLREFALNSWNSPDQAREDLMNSYHEKEHSALEDVIGKLAAGAAVFAEMGMNDDRTSEHVWLAPLPVALPPKFGCAPSEYMAAIRDEEIVFILSPFELPWLRTDAIETWAGNL